MLNNKTRLKSQYLSFIIVIITTAVLAFYYSKMPSNAIPSELDTYIEDFIYSSHRDLKYSKKNDGSTDRISYKVQINYPATDLIEFYEKAMKKHGFAYYDNIQDCNREWSYYTDGTLPNEPEVASISLCWSKENKIALLLLKYHYFEKEGSPFILETNSDLDVIFYILDK